MASSVMRTGSRAGSSVRRFRPSAPSRTGRSRRSGSIAGGIGTRAGGRRVFAQLAADLGHGAGEGATSTRRWRSVSVATSWAVAVATSACAVSQPARRARASVRASSALADTAAPAPAARAGPGARPALGVMPRHGARLLHALAGGGELGAGDRARARRGRQPMPQPHQHLSGLDAVAFLHAQPASIRPPATASPSSRAGRPRILAGAGALRGSAWPHRPYPPRACR